MGLVEFVRKQLIDVLEWTEEDDETLVWRFPVADREIQQGAQLVVRETQAAILVHEGRTADVFGPGRWTLTTGNVPVLADLRHWAKGFESPIKSDVYFVSTRLRLDRTWGTPAPVAVRDAEFGSARVRAFGVYGFRVAVPATFLARVAGSRAAYAASELEGQLRATLVEALAVELGTGGVPFLDLAARQDALAAAVAARAAEGFAALGLVLDGFRITSFSLPAELQQRLDERIGMGIVGDVARWTAFQTGRAIPAAAEAGGVAGAGVGMGLGMAMGQTMGRAVGAAAAPAACARCGAGLAEAHRFCPACGAARG